MAPDSLPPVIAEKYLPRRLIGSGGMGTVYEVEHSGTGERLALKVLRCQPNQLSRGLLERFWREARVAAWVKSEHIVRVIDVGTASELGGIPYLVMDLLQGENLADTAGCEPQEPLHVVHWLAQVARGLDRAHANGVVHRDLKPENLFLTQRTDADPIVKILDFGVAKIRMSEDTSRTASGEVLGTPLYMAPEQAAGDNDKIGPATDVWALGMLAFRLLSGREYWKAVNRNLLMIDILQKPIKRPSECNLKLGAAFDAWFLRSCQRNPAERWPSARAQITALAQALGVVMDGRDSSSDPALATTLPLLGGGSSTGSSLLAPRLTVGLTVTLVAAGLAFLWLTRAPSAPEISPPKSVPASSVAEAETGSSMLNTEPPAQPVPKEASTAIPKAEHPPTTAATARSPASLMPHVARPTITRDPLADPK